MPYTEEELRRMKEQAGILDSENSEDSDNGSEGKNRIGNLNAGQYILLPQTSTYALGVQSLMRSCQPGDPHPLFPVNGGDGDNEVFRPLTFEENIRARVEDFETLHDENGSERSLDDRLCLFGSWLDSCTGMAYKAGTTKFKIVPVCNELIQIDSGFNQSYLPVDYDSFNGFELDSGQDKYRRLLTKQEILVHPAWLAVVEDDKDLLRTYADIFFSEKGNPEELMGFWVRQNTNTDELRALCVNSLGGNSNANGCNLLINGRFVRVAQRENSSGNGGMQ